MWSRRCMRRSVGPGTPVLGPRVASRRSCATSKRSRLKFEATSTDRSVLDALDWALLHWTLTRDHLPDHYVTRDDKGDEVRVEIDTSFASGNGRRSSGSWLPRGGR